MYSERKKLRKFSVLGIKNHTSAAVRAPPTGSASVKYGQIRYSTSIHGLNVYKSYHDFEFPNSFICCIGH